MATTQSARDARTHLSPHRAAQIAQVEQIERTAEDEAWVVRDLLAAMGSPRVIRGRKVA